MKTLSVWLIFWVNVVCGAELQVLTPHQFTEGELMEIRVAVPDAEGQNLQWRIMLENAPLASGRLRVNAEKEAVLSIKAPLLRTGEAMPLRLILLEDGNEKKRSETILWIFPRDPLKVLRAKFKERPLQVYDPPGDTTAWLKEAEIPYQKCWAPEGAAGKVLLIGEGVSFKKDPELAENLRKLVGEGMSILCLQPEEGFMDLWNAETGPLPQKWGFAGDDFYEKWDKRLRASGLKTQRFNLEAVRGQVRLNLDSEQGWPWATLHYEGGGSLSLCGVEIVSSKSTSPGPQVLFSLLVKKAL